MSSAVCRICLEEEGVFVSPCNCKGSQGFVHQQCLSKWVSESGRNTCELCNTPYAKHNVVACNLTNYCRGIFSSNISSEIERTLIKLSSLHIIFGIFLFAWSSVESWMMLSSLETLVSALFLVLFQIYHHDVDYFVLRVLIYWNASYLLSLTIVSAIQTMDNGDECAMHCYRLQRTICSKKCVLYDYYQKKDTLSYNVMTLRLIEFFLLLGFRFIALCFTHMNKTVYYNLSLSDENESDSLRDDEESNPLLSC